MSYKIKKDGEWVTVANGSRMFVGTTAAIDAAIARGELKYPDLYAETDDYPTDEDVAHTEYTPQNISTGSVWLKGCYYEKKNGVVEVGVALAGWADKTSAVIFTLPENCRPSKIVRTPASGNDRICNSSIAVHPNGNIEVRRNTETSQGVVDVGCLGTLTFIAAS